MGQIRNRAQGPAGKADSWQRASRIGRVRAPGLAGVQPLHALHASGQAPHLSRQGRGDALV